ncbi:MAG: penicillin-binding protein 2 [Lachnospiraceae bacterium]|nr:penicillin-binding protein 2 [Lachnospiraceae bacterium]
MTDREKQKKSKKKGKSRSRREYTNILLLFTGIFALLIVYLAWFQITQSRSVINNSYNARLEILEDEVVRGSILATGGEVLAYTQVSEDGTEKRVYPYGCTFSHVLGYSEYGKTGIEELGNFQLINSNAYFVERFLNEIQGQKSTGDSLVTTLDVDLQTVAHDALGTNDGAVIVMEASTGNIRAMVSKPDYDPGTVAANWSSLSNSDDGVLLNRATQGLYAPGSTFKTITLLEYLRENNMDGSEYSYNCSGKITVGDTSISCYHGTAHGELDLEGAFAESCNSAFADIGSGLDVDSFQELAQQLLFDTELPVSLSYNQRSVSLYASAAAGIRLMTAIGPGETRVTPMHMALIMSAIANDGVLMTPRFLERTENYTGTLVESYPTSVYGNLMTSAEASVLQSYLRAVVEYGTGTALQSDDYTVYGKTGTAEYSSNKDESHAWFTGYASGEKEDLVVVVIVEGAGSGSAYAVPIAKKIFEAYYAQ